jgi:hypothetical protein
MHFHKRIVEEGAQKILKVSINLFDSKEVVKGGEGDMINTLLTGENLSLRIHESDFPA